MQEMYEKPRQAANLAMTTALDGLARAFRVQVRDCLFLCCMTSLDLPEAIIRAVRTLNIECLHLQKRVRLAVAYL